MPRARPDSQKCAGTTSDGNPCKRWAIKGSEYCKTHSIQRGEATRFKSGPLHPNWKNGRYSRYVFATKPLIESYEAAESDPELLNQRAEIAVLTLRLQGLIQEIESRESGQWWKLLQVSVADFKRANAAKDQAIASAALSELFRLISAGSQEHMVWEEIRSTIVDKDKVIKSERARIKEMEGFVTAEAAIVMQVDLSLSLREALEKHVPDVAQQKKVMTHYGLTLQKYMGGGKNAQRPA